MIDIKDISKSFGKLSVLRGIDLNLNRGQCVALIGPNGCGKTTLIKIILSMVMADKGEVIINGQLITKGIAYKKMIGYMPQIGRYPQNMTIGQIIEMVQSIRNTSENLDLSLFHSFGMDGLLDKKMGTLSGGTMQKVSAVLAFMFNPPILILDEPTAGLDPISAEILKEKIIAERNNGKLIIITSHLLSELDNMVSEIIFMQEGKVAFHQSVDKLKSSTGSMNISEAILSILKSKVNE
ncbi:ABC transporter ATP-binding protein [Sediminibacterium salmoneum]|uniref:ABC transporter ATP-binding protein n=1 Tax=Sediminibacterium salmoneum TaxID=426421 RepID=UPI000478AE1C|nr:ABC transporter ATP-binding protein [Sediminibacterium salmoneum]